MADGANVVARVARNDVEPLCLACQHGHLGIAQWLHGKGASVDAADYEGLSPLHHACVGRHLDVALWLHNQSASVDATDDEGDTPLHKACFHGHLNVAQWLLSVGASINATNNVGITPLHLGCTGGHLGIAQWLLSTGASIDTTCDGGDTPLHVACSHGHLNVAQWLHSAGASVNTTDIEGETPLHIACLEGHFDVITWLCDVGADATAKRDDGDTPAQLFQRGHQPSNECYNAHEREFKTTMDALLAAQRHGAEERARAAETTLLAEEAAPLPPVVKSKSKAKAKSKVQAQDGPAPAQSAAGSSSDVLSPPLPPLSDDADAALRVAMEARDLETLKATINRTASVASDAVLKEARALREQLKERELKAKKQLRREAEAARVHEAREAPARHALQALLDASGRVALRAALARAEALVEDFSELLFDAMVAGYEQQQQLDLQLVEESRAEAKTRHVEEHALRFEVCLVRFAARARGNMCQMPYDLCAFALRLHRPSRSTRSPSSGQREIRCTTPTASRASCA